MRTIVKTTLILFAGIAMTACGQKWQEESKDGYNLVTQKNGQTLGYSPASGVQILTKGGYAFKDLNRNGKVDVYEDWRKDPLVRAKDLASQLSIDEIAGMMLYSGHQAINRRSQMEQQRPGLRRGCRTRRARQQFLRPPPRRQGHGRV